ncbi:MAG: hypothetical protein WD000_04315 [Thermodesulfobacteriota bacterium]
MIQKAAVAVPKIALVVDYPFPQEKLIVATLLSDQLAKIQIFRRVKFRIDTWFGIQILYI